MCGAFSADHHCRRQFSDKFSAGALGYRAAIPTLLFSLMSHPRWDGAMNGGTREVRINGGEHAFAHCGLLVPFVPLPKVADTSYGSGRKKRYVSITSAREFGVCFTE